MLRDQLLAPAPAQLTDFLNLHLRSGDCLVQIAGECEVLYHGRAMSMAEAGNYLVIVKCDGSVMVHGPKSVKPVNWQPRTDEVSARTEDGRCVLTAYRKSPEETVRVAFLEPSVAMALELQEEVGYVLTGSEKDMQGALARNPQLIEEGLIVLDRELISSVGDIDLYARDSQGRFVVVELKRGKATQEAVHQLQRYVQAVQPLVPHAVRGILAAPAITHPARVQLERLQLEFREIQALPKPEELVSQPALF